MKKDHLKVFYLLDNHYYLVNENPKLKKILNFMNSKYHDYDIQKFIDRLISWYSIKFSDKFLASLFDDDIHTDTTILDIMNFDALRKNYGVFENELFDVSNNDAKIILQKRLIVMAGWGLIYNKNSTPEYGYYRAEQLLNDFNSFYSWKLTPSVYLPVLKKDYSPHNEENIKLIEKNKKKHHDKNKTSRIKKKLFR